MHIRVGYELIYYCPQATPMILLVNIHYSRASDIVIPDYPVSYTHLTLPTIYSV